MRERYASVFRRSRGRCVYCETIRGPFQVDHAVPIIRGGSNKIQNLVLACKPCNTAKGYRTAAEFANPDVQVEQPQTSYRMFCAMWRRF